MRLHSHSMHMNNVAVMRQCSIQLKIFNFLFLQLQKRKVLQHIKTNLPSNSGLNREKRLYSFVMKQAASQITLMTLCKMQHNMYTLHFLSNVHPLLDDLKQMQQVLNDPQYRANKSSKQVATCMHANAYVCVKLSALLVPVSSNCQRHYQ